MSYTSHKCNEINLNVATWTLLPGGESRSPLHAALLHLRCTGSGAFWQTWYVKQQKLFFNSLITATVWTASAESLQLHLSLFSLHHSYIRELFSNRKRSHLHDHIYLNIARSVGQLLSCASTTIREGRGLTKKALVGTKWEQLGDKEVAFCEQLLFLCLHIEEKNRNDVWLLYFPAFVRLLDVPNDLSPLSAPLFRNCFSCF